MVAAMATTAPTSATQGRGGVNGSISSDSPDTTVRNPNTTTTTTLAATVETTKASDNDSKVDEKTVKLELTNMSTAASKDDVNDEDSEDEELIESEKPTRNAWAAKKTVAQGMMDIALLTSNANQLRYLIMYGKHSSTYAISITLVAISILLQVGVGVVLIFKGHSDLKGEEKKAHANRLNNYVVVGVFLVTVINVFAASFSDVSPTVPAPATALAPM